MKNKLIIHYFLLLLIIINSCKQKDKIKSHNIDKYEKIVDFISTDSAICKITASIDCANPFGTDKIGSLMRLLFHENDSNDCLDVIPYQTVPLSVINGDVSFLPTSDEVYTLIFKLYPQMNMDSLKVIEANRFYFDEKTLETLSKHKKNKQVLIIKPITDRVFYAEFKVRLTNDFFPFSIFYYLFIDDENKVQKIFSDTSQR